MKPIIGIVGRPNFPDENSSMIVVVDYYRKAIIENGGIPLMILPPQLIEYNNSKPSEVVKLSEDEKLSLKRQLQLCDGILMPGGYKVFEHDFLILEYAINNDIPILGICLGMQIMSNYKEEYYNEKNDNVKVNHYDLDNEYSHVVKLDKNSKLYSIFEHEKIKVNSLHNYHVVKAGKYKVVGLSEDGLIEALEYPQNKFNIGVQWHPERLKNDELQNKLFESFIESSKK